MVGSLLSVKPILAENLPDTIRQNPTFYVAGERRPQKSNWRGLGAGGIFLRHLK
jgi:hypothetical protein